jgi:sugar-specific transcriptional regulator TrmB/DNA-binding CsgD family transcriptional regulator
MFEALGLNSVTESVYFALLEAPDADLDDISNRLGLTDEQTRAALDDLAQMSLVHASLYAPGTVRPVNPTAGLAALVARRQREIDESKSAFEALLAARSDSRARTADPDVERLQGIVAIRGRLQELAMSCEWEASSFMPGGAQSAASLVASRELDAEAIDRGVRLRTVYLDSVRNEAATLEYAVWLGELGSEVRTVPTLPLRMLIVDRKIAVVPVNTEDSQAEAIMVSSSGVVAALYALFQSVWKTARPLGSPRQRDDHALSAQDRQVLKFLATGLTDEMIARRMGVSVRTARRIASDLLARLDARSRFQAGARAAAREWITEDDLD